MNNENQANEDRLKFLGQPQTQSGMGNKTYTKIVRILKLALPLMAVVIIAVIFAWPKMQAPDLPEPGEDLITSNIEKNELIKPRFESRDDKNQPFTITADTATQNVRNPDVVELSRPMADMHLNNGASIAIEADNGTYAQKAEKLVLEGKVRLSHDGGYEMVSDKLMINIEKQQAITDQNVSGHGPEGTIEATGMQADGQNKKLVFTGPAKLTLYQKVKGIE